jgi:TetR/AcrR family transcriptional regulator
MEPIVFHYMMIGLTATLSEFGPEMSITSKLAADDPDLANSYWRAIEKMVFHETPSDTDIDAVMFQPPSPNRR